MQTLAPTRAKMDSEAYINPREHRLRGSKIPLTKSGAARSRRRAGIEPRRSPRAKTSGDSTVVTEQGPTGPRSV